MFVCGWHVTKRFAYSYWFASVSVARVLSIYPFTHQFFFYIIYKRKIEKKQITTIRHIHKSSIFYINILRNLRLHNTWKTWRIWYSWSHLSWSSHQLFIVHFTWTLELVIQRKTHQLLKFMNLTAYIEGHVSICIMKVPTQYTLWRLIG
jgi:hypothetical protein